MKTKLLTAIVALTFLLLSVNRSAAFDKQTDVIADFVLVRPGCFVATIIGATFFVISLPVAMLSKSVRKTAHTLVAVPARHTFTRPLGDFTELLE